MHISTVIHRVSVSFRKSGWASNDNLSYHRLHLFLVISLLAFLDLCCVSWVCDNAVVRLLDSGLIN